MLQPPQSLSGSAEYRTDHKILALDGHFTPEGTKGFAERAVKEKSVIVRERGASKPVSLGPNKVTFILFGAQSGGRFSIKEFEAIRPQLQGRRFIHT